MGIIGGTSGVNWCSALGLKFDIYQRRPSCNENFSMGIGYVLWYVRQAVHFSLLIHPKTMAYSVLQTGCWDRDVKVCTSCTRERRRFSRNELNESTCPRVLVLVQVSGFPLSKKFYKTPTHSCIAVLKGSLANRKMKDK